MNIKYFFFIFIIHSCAPKPIITTVSYKSYSVKSGEKETAMQQLLNPYTEGVSKALDKVIGFSNYNLFHKKPESPLGNFIADVIKQKAEDAYKIKLDAAIINSGSIKSGLPKGNITIRNIYELLPYENALVVQRIKGNILQQLLEHAMHKGGWPVSSITITVDGNKKIKSIVINNNPLDVHAEYSIALPDFLAAGGDGCSMLKAIPAENNFVSLREGIMEYIKQVTKEGKAINTPTEKRIIYE